MKKLEKEGKISPIMLSEFEEMINSPSLNKLLNDWLSRTPINGSLPSDSNDEQIVSDYMGLYELGCFLWNRTDHF